MKNRGSVYIMVLVTSAFVLATGLAALSLEQRVHERAQVEAGVASARFAARSGLDLAVQTMVEDPLWRGTVAGSGLYLTRTIDAGDRTYTVRVYAEDGDGLIDDGDLDPFTLRVVADEGSTRRQLRVELQPTPLPVDVLLFGAYAANQVKTGSLAAVNGDAGISASANFSGTESTFFVPVETENNSVDAATYTSTVTLNGPAREFPPDDHVAGLYAPYGTTISVSDLGYDGSNYVIDKQAIGPGLNPFGLTGALNPDDVYVIDQGAKDVIIRDSRIVGTLVFLGGGKILVENSVSWAPATPGWPALVSESDVIFNTTSNSLSESVLNTNFNPVGFGDGNAEDLDQNDFYVSQIRGIVYSRNHITVETGSIRIVGTVICKRDLTIGTSSILDLRASTDSLDAVPPGFESVQPPKMVVTSWLDP